MSPAPTLRRERELFRAGAHRVAGVDEVGRGAIAGPVSVGITVITETTRTAPVGLRDSKLLTPQARERLAPRVVRWATESAVGHATPSEIDDFGLTAALRLAALRALEQVGRPDVIILDGSHDWLTEPAPTLFDIVPWPACGVPQVSTVIRADRSCSSVAAASVIAKVTRDGLMTALHDRHGGYGWDVNKGYSTPEHGEAVRSLGLTEQHRRSWNLACCDDPDPDSSTDVLAEVHTVDLREVVPSAT